MSWRLVDGTEPKSAVISMEGFANESGLISEQVWDSPDIAEHQLFFGRPSGSAMPLVWAHAEYVKLRRSLEDGKVFDMPTHAFERYVQQHAPCSRTYWRFEQPCRKLPAGFTLRLEVLAAAHIRWSTDGWQTMHDSPTTDTGIGLHYVDLESAGMRPGAVLQFTFLWLESDRWEGKNFAVEVEGNLPEPKNAEVSGRYDCRSLPGSPLRRHSKSEPFRKVCRLACDGSSQMMILREQ